MTEGEDAMDLEIMYDLREEVLKTYRYYQPSVYEDVKSVCGDLLTAEECLKN